MQIVRKIYPLDITTIYPELQTITSKLEISQAEAIRQAIRYYAEWVQNLKIVKPRNIPIEQAKKEILEFLDKQEDIVYTDEIAEALNIEFNIVHKALMELWKDGDVVREEN